MSDEPSSASQFRPTSCWLAGKLSSRRIGRTNVRWGETARLRFWLGLDSGWLRTCTSTGGLTDLKRGSTGQRTAKVVNQRNRLRLLDKALEPKSLSDPEVCCVQSVISLSFAQRTATPASKLSSALTWMLGGSTSSTACRCPAQGSSAKRGSHVVGQEPLRNWLDFPGTESFPQRFLSLRGLGMAGCRLYYMVGRQRSRQRSRQRRRSRQRQRDGRVS